MQQPPHLELPLMWYSQAPPLLPWLTVDFERTSCQQQQQTHITADYCVFYIFNFKCVSEPPWRLLTGYTACWVLFLLLSKREIFSVFSLSCSSVLKDLQYGFSLASHTEESWVSYHQLAHWLILSSSEVFASSFSAQLTTCSLTSTRTRSSPMALLIVKTPAESRKHMTSQSNSLPIHTQTHTNIHISQEKSNDSVWWSSQLVAE